MPAGSRAAVLAATVAALLATTALAAVADVADPAAPPAAVATDPPVPSSVADLLAAQLASASRAHGQVEAKRAERAAARQQRLRIAYKLLRGAGSPLTVAPERRMAVARSRATARLLLARDQAEVTQLADEARLLAAAIARIERDRAVPLMAVPVPLARPVAGAVARRFGTVVHERSGAILARRGVDFDVLADADVVAPAAGVIRYAGPIRGLDHGVIIDHGGYWTVIAKLAPVAFAPDVPVARGGRIGHPLKRRVYLEVRLGVGPGGTPVDPEPLLAPGT